MPPALGIDDGCQKRKNNSTSVFFRFVASEKMSNRSKIDSLVAENEHFIARAPNEAFQKWSFLRCLLAYKGNRFITLSVFFLMV